MKEKAGRGINQEAIASISSSLTPESIQATMLERAKTAVMSLAVSLLESDVESLCGASYARKGEALCHRGGSENTSVIIGSARYGVRRPRVRNGKQEVELPTLAKLRDQDLLDAKMRERMLLGVSTRNYDAVIDGYAQKLSTSRSSVSRAFKRASQKDLDEINHGDLSKHRFVAIAIDGIEIGRRMVVAAIGIAEDLSKIPLGLREGDTENPEIVKDLLSGIQDRGFTLCCDKLLAVIDGSKALAKGLRAVFGERLLLQRCWIHKLRNLRTHLPENHHGTVHWRMKRLMTLKTYADANKEYDSLHRWLAEISPEAAESLDEAGEELLTLHRLGISGKLRESLSCTNMIESLFSVVREKVRRVKNWKSKGSSQILRWVASATIEHKTKMRKIFGYAQASEILDALGRIKIENVAA